MAFPESDLITVFDNPTVENPLSQGGTWTQSRSDRSPLQAVSPGRAMQSSAGDPNYSHYIGDSYTGDYIEAWCCTQGGQLGAALETWRVFLMLDHGGGDIDEFQGYLLWYGGAISKSYQLHRYDNNATNPLLFEIGGGYPQKLGIAINGDIIECWNSDGTTWNMLGSAEDDTYRGTFRAGCGIEDPTSGTPGSLEIPCFGAGVEEPFVPQFYRRPYD